MNKPPLSSAQPYVKHKGFTLPEVLISMAVTSIIGLGVVQMTMYIAKSTVSTNNRINAVTRSYIMASKLKTIAQDAGAYVVYSDFGSEIGGYSDPTLSGTTILVQDYHKEPITWNGHLMLDGQDQQDYQGNFMILVEFYDDTDPSDWIPGAVKKITGVYVGPREWLVDSTKVEPDYIPVRRFTKEYTADQGALSSTRVLDNLIPEFDESHEIIGYVSKEVFTQKVGIFTVVSDSSVNINIPMKVGLSENAPSYFMDTTLYMSGL